MGSTSGPLSVCCLSLPRSKKGKCHPPTEVGPLAVNVTSVYYIGKMIHIQGGEFSRNLQPEGERVPAERAVAHFVVSLDLEASF